MIFFLIKLNYVNSMANKYGVVRRKCNTREEVWVSLTLPIFCLFNFEIQYKCKLEMSEGNIFRGKSLTSNVEAKSMTHTNLFFIQNFHQSSISPTPSSLLKFIFHHLPLIYYLFSPVKYHKAITGKSSRIPWSVHFFAVEMAWNKIKA